MNYRNNFLFVHVSCLTNLEGKEIKPPKQQQIPELSNLISYRIINNLLS